MVFGGIKGLFGRAAQPAQRATGPLGLGIGRAASLDIMRLRLEESRLAMKLPPDTLVITGHGTAPLDDTSVIHRYYDDNHTTLQFLCNGGIGDESLSEITLYHLWDELVPQTHQEWAVWDGPDAKIGQAVFEADGFRFERVWGDPSTPWIPPAEFTEDVEVEGGPARAIHQKIMPYRREVGVLIETLLIAVERDLASNDRGSITFMIGYGMSPADVTPV